MKALALFAMTAVATPLQAHAQDFFAGKTINLLSSSSVGGANDAYTRLLARHMGRHIPGNPTIIVQNLPGAGGVTLANQLYITAPRDGTTMGNLQRTLLLDPLLLDKSFQFKPLEMNWLGSLNRETNLLIVAGNSKVKTLADARTVETVLAAAQGGGTDGVMYPRLMNRFLGTKFKVVTGYSGDAGMMLAIERGEVEGRGGVPWSAIKLSSADKLRDGRIRIVTQLGLKKSPELPDVPMLLDEIKDDIARQTLEILFARQDMGRPFVLPQGLPADRVNLLRTAFVATTKDPEFKKEADKAKFDIDVMDGEEMQALMTKIYSLPKETIERVKKVIKEVTAD
jgi:tripartite-type tricarboxylate transporter receptor subunit TctC